MRFSIGADVITTPSTELSAMTSERGRGRGRGSRRDFVGRRGLFGGGRGLYSSRQTVGNKEPRQE